MPIRLLILNPRDQRKNNRDCITMGDDRQSRVYIGISMRHRDDWRMHGPKRRGRYNGRFASCANPRGIRATRPLSPNAFSSDEQKY